MSTVIIQMTAEDAKAKGMIVMPCSKCGLEHYTYNSNKDYNYCKQCWADMNCVWI